MMRSIRWMRQWAMALCVIGGVLSLIPMAEGGGGGQCDGTQKGGVCCQIPDVGGSADKARAVMDDRTSMPRVLSNASDVEEGDGDRGLVTVTGK